jgi:NhaP-type Na+/H+ or K+/H+ antiporter
MVFDWMVMSVQHSSSLLAFLINQCDALLDQVILGIVIGACLGLGFRYIMKFALRKGFIDRESYVTQYIALSLMSIGLTGLLGSDDLLAAFAAGEPISES